MQILASRMSLPSTVLETTLSSIEFMESALSESVLRDLAHSILLDGFLKIDANEANIFENVLGGRGMLACLSNVRARF